MRLVTYNIYFGQRERMDALTAVLRHCRPDIATLNEADDRDVVAALAKRLDMHYIWAQGSGDRHIGTLSRYPIDDWTIYNRPPLTQAVLATTHATPAGPLTVYNLHFLPFLLLPFELHRWRATGALLGVIAANGAQPHLIAGDINAIAPGDRVLQRNNPARMRRVMALQLGIIFKLAVPRLLRAGYTDCFRALNPDADGFTWMPGNRTTRYDYIMAPPALRAALRACFVADDAPRLAEASDHFPLVADFDFG